MDQHIERSGRNQVYFMAGDLTIPPAKKSAKKLKQDVDISDFGKINCFTVHLISKRFLQQRGIMKCSNTFGKWTEPSIFVTWSDNVLQVFMEFVVVLSHKYAVLFHWNEYWGLTCPTLQCLYNYIFIYVLGGGGGGGELLLTSVWALLEG